MTKLHHCPNRSDSDSDVSEDYVEPQKSTCNVTPKQMALHVSNNLLLFKNQNEDEEVAGAMFNAITLLEGAQLNQTKKIKQSNILQYFKP